MTKTQITESTSEAATNDHDVTHTVCHCTNDDAAWCGLDASEMAWHGLDEETVECPLCGLAEEVFEVVGVCRWGCPCDECGGEFE